MSLFCLPFTNMEGVGISLRSQMDLQRLMKMVVMKSPSNAPHLHPTYPLIRSRANKRIHRSRREICKSVQLLETYCPHFDTLPISQHGQPRFGPVSIQGLAGPLAGVRNLKRKSTNNKRLTVSENYNHQYKH